MPTEIKLHSTQNGSDKVYELRIVPVAASTLYNVVYSNGRRTSGATAGNKVKNPHPIRHQEAELFMRFLAQKKIDSGYHPFGDCSLCGWDGIVHPFLNLPPPQVIPVMNPPKPKPKHTKIQEPTKPTLVVAPKVLKRTIAFDDEDL